MCNVQQNEHNLELGKCLGCLDRIPSFLKNKHQFLPKYGRLRRETLKVKDLQGQTLTKTWNCYKDTVFRRLVCDSSNKHIESAE